jgi:hypothetical protein
MRLIGAYASTGHASSNRSAPRALSPAARSARICWRLSMLQGEADLASNGRIGLRHCRPWRLPASGATAASRAARVCHDRQDRWRRDIRWRRLGDVKSGPVSITNCSRRLELGEKGSAGICDAPAIRIPKNQCLGENIEAGRPGCQALRSVRPVGSTGNKNSDVASKVRQWKMPSLGSGQDLEYRDLETHSAHLNGIPESRLSPVAS